MVALTEDEIDDVLYLARTNEVDELSQYLTELSTSKTSSKADVLGAATDAISGNTALHYAAANGHVTIFDILKEASAPNALAHLNLQNESGNTPLHWAAVNGHLPFVQVLVKEGADAGIINKAGHDAVFEAELNDKAEVVEWLLKEAEGLEKGIDSEQSGSGANEEELPDSELTRGVEKMDIKNQPKG